VNLLWERGEALCTRCQRQESAEGEEEDEQGRRRRFTGRASRTPGVHGQLAADYTIEHLSGGAGKR
jgi:hypothetical protein